MCCCFETGMERVKTLMALRQSTKNIPDKLLNDKNFTQQIKIIKWLLNSKADERPTADEILQSDAVPLAKVETNELQDMLRHVLNNPQSKIYKHLIARCLEQENDIVCELTYHMDMMTIFPTYEFVKYKIRDIFKRHGAIEMTTPLLTPYTHKNSTMPNAVKLMTHSGSIVTLPYDLRSSFINYVSLNGVNFLRRYSISRVFREKRVFNFHPRQIYECAFDIITPNRGNLMVDAEILWMAYSITNELPTLKNCNISFQINHSGLLNAIYLYCNIPHKYHSQIDYHITEFLENKLSKFQFSSLVTSLIPTAKETVSVLIELIQVEVSVNNISNSTLRKLLRGRNDIAQLAKSSIKELETVINLAIAFGVSVSKANFVMK